MARARTIEPAFRYVNVTPVEWARVHRGCIPMSACHPGFPAL